MSINSNIQSSYLAKEREYWLTKLKGDIPDCGLPLDFKPADRQRGEIQTLAFAIDPDVAERIARASRGNDALLFAILVGALKICLNKYTDLNDIAIGSAIHERHKDVVLSNRVLVLRDSVGDAMTVRQVLDGVRQTLAEAYANQRYPVQTLHHPDDGGNQEQPLFRVAAVLDTIHDPENVMEQGQDVTLKFSGCEKNIATTIYFDPTRLRLETCEQFAGHYRHVLREMMAHPDKLVAELQLVSNEQRRQLLRARNSSRREYPREATIQALFEEQCRLRPGSNAVRYEGRSLTYQELNGAANRLAFYLREKGAGPEVPVGICLERSLEMVIGILGILKSGSAYVPIDPEYPPDRQQAIINDSNLRLMVAAADWGRELSQGIELVHLKQEQRELMRQSEANPENHGDAKNLAYIMYTSGSTGMPKGVAVPHRAVVRLVKAANYVELGEGEKVLQFAPLSFDASTFEIWGSLCNGAELVVMGAGKVSLEMLVAAIQENEIGTMWLTSGLFQLAVDYHLDALKRVGQLLVGGDVVPVAQAQRYLDVAIDGKVINGYGPTENTTFTCCHTMVAGTKLENNVPIGTPISNTEVYIVDRNIGPAPTGVAGELYIGGDGLARGYVNAPELTAEKFIPNPFSDKEGERLYRSGDLARYRWDGAIEFIGRADEQVKIRGFRIEPGEVEVVLGKHKDVRGSVVVVEERNGQKTLTAYVAAREELTRRELRKYLEEKLPQHMIPATLVKISEIPLTGSGKVDRIRLTQLRTSSRANEAEELYVAPRNETEELIADIWKEALNVERVGIFDNFFELGGHSLLAMKICTKMSRKLMCEAKVTDLFRNPTIDSLAHHLEEKNAAAISQAV